MLEERDCSTRLTRLSSDIGTLNNEFYNAYTVVYCGMNVETTIDGVLISGGNADGSVDSSHPERSNGGGIYTNGILTVMNSIITGNSGPFRRWSL